MIISARPPMIAADSARYRAQSTTIIQ